MKLQIDLDGVLVDFMQGASKLAQKIDPSIPLVTTKTTKDWNNWEGWSRELTREVWKRIEADPFFFYGLDSLVPKDDLRRLRNLHKPGNEIYFVTSRPGKTSKWQSEQWLWDRLEVQATVVMASDKARFARLITPDMSVEDNTVNADAIGQVIGADRSYIIDRLYNQNLSFGRAVRIYTFKEFLDKVEEKFGRA